ncbi:pilus-associated sortase [Streptococcus sanguinis]|uniref:Pilus-associated sortase n=2 Tax=Streptococcus sanguinis TaxID=1305 RepID=A0A0B7GMA5_STRSA|nr:pilus-associated sortase [Streptococcus sanguinis]
MNIMKKHLINFLLILFLISGIGLLLYPTVSDLWNSYHQSQAISNYENKVEKLDTSKADEMRATSEFYNQTLEKGVVPNYRLSEEEKKTYNSLLDVTGTGIMAYVEIPTLGTNLPIYHGTDDAILQVAIGHIPGSSLPVGGQGTHSVISGHRGLPSAKLFTDIDKLKNGDRFMIHVLGKTITYQVEQILIVEPDDVSSLAIDPEQDYCTLVTCTPYGINSHRLLVRGHRVPNEEKASKSSKKKDSIPCLYILIFLLVLVLILILLFWILHRRREKKRAELRRQTGLRSAVYRKRNKKGRHAK